MIVGIDLGTTNSLVASWKDGKAQIIRNALGEVLTPSCVAADDDGTIVVGRAARDIAVARPQATASVFKRAMGTGKEYRLAGRIFRAEELSALVLKALKEDAEAHFGERVDGAVITVPAYFNDMQRKATRTAGEIAGLRVERLLNEPTAAALAYGLHHRPPDSRFLVFDLGGGTFDVSILEWFEGVMEVRASTGDAFLGGEDFVDVLVNEFAARHEDRFGRHLPEPLLALVRESAERAKRRLSDHGTATMEANYEGECLAVEVDEETFQKLSRPLLERIAAPVTRAIRDSRLALREIDEVILVGGATRMPLVRKLAARLFGRIPAMHLNPDEAIALGAAVQAGLVVQDAALEELVLTDVAPHSLGIEIARQVDNREEPGYFAPLIERNTVIPASRMQQFSPTRDFQRSVRLQVFQGEGRMVRDNVHLGTLEVPLPGGRRDESAIDVRFTYDVSGMLEVEATAPGAARPHRLVIQSNAGSLKPEEIDERLRELAQLKVLPRERAEVRAVVARGERLYAERLGGERVQIGQLMTQFDAVLSRQDPNEIRHACLQVHEALDAIEGVPRP